MNAEPLQRGPDLADGKLAESLARTLRHEVGDFLQKVYASVAILKTQLPADASLELDVLARLRARAELCRELIDAIQDFLCPIQLACEHVNLAGVAQDLVSAAGDKHPGLKIAAEASGPLLALVDPGRAAQVGKLLLANAIEAAQGRVTFRTRLDLETEAVEWSVIDDGPGVSPEVAGRLFTPFFTTRAAHAGLGLALARKIVLLHRGRIAASNQPEGGFQASAWFPMQR